ncbi:N-acetyltransferase [Companilactobacillus sp. RD055328]|uniref:GNAT family N-acetyltransferase n=1 Tax=Companilactobacillus sp. RD055328 TaxID=2916634 RepID=UPI001FC7F334|nr:GNAT family N-acetyltransferase [Companilactobacillus sp. RD055328]GKQ43236.1 N-acetyltransferase [Companilactobacillus sp. RD055328]
MATIYMKKATEQDLPRVLDIIDLAKKTLKKRGVDQWQNGYPDPVILEQDIKDGINYIMVLDGEIVGTAALQQGIEENYETINEGKWDENSKPGYTVIHRIAVDPNYSGHNLSDTMIHHLLTLSRELGYTDVRIDTHFENMAMQHVIEKNGFIHRGTITMMEDENSVPRIAYQMLIE